VLDLTRVDKEIDGSGDQSWAVKKNIDFFGLSRHFPALVWLCRLRVGLYMTYIDLKLCFCSFYWYIMFVSIQLCRNIFCLLNKFVAKMLIFDAHLCSGAKSWSWSKNIFTIPAKGWWEHR
jgi:hypothetical protein